MLKQILLIGLLALALRANARHVTIVPDSLHNKVINLETSNAEIAAKWHRKPDEGYPKFDGNPFKRKLVESFENRVRNAAKYLSDEDNAKSLMMSASRTDWASFDEFSDYWGIALVKDELKHPDTYNNDNNSDSDNYDSGNDNDDDSDEDGNFKVKRYISSEEERLIKEQNDMNELQERIAKDMENKYQNSQYELK